MATPPQPPDNHPAPSPALSQLPPVPGSPAYSYASTAIPPTMAAQYANLYSTIPPPPPPPAHPLLTKSDLESSSLAYADVLATAKTYRLALAALSTASSAFGAALEGCARLKESRSESVLLSDGGPPPSDSNTPNLSTSRAAPTPAFTADTLLAASGLHHLVSNHHQILSETVYRSFEVPLLHDLDKWRAAVDDERDAYDRSVRDQSREIGRLEKEGAKAQQKAFAAAKNSGKKANNKRGAQQQNAAGAGRDVAALRAHLVQLTGKLDGLTALHASHARALLRESQEASARVCDVACSLVRAEVDIYEALARKGWSGGGLEDVLEKGVDLFAPDDEHDYPSGSRADGGAGGQGSKLFSILPPLSILADSASASEDTTAGEGGGSPVKPYRAAPGRSESMLSEGGGDRYQSLAGAMSPRRRRGGGADTESLFSEPGTRSGSGAVRRGGGVRPFSPQPMPVDPEEVMGKLAGLRMGSERESEVDDDGAPNGDENEEDGNEIKTPRPTAAFRMLPHVLDEEDAFYENSHSQPWRDEGRGERSGRQSPSGEANEWHNVEASR